MQPIDVRNQAKLSLARTFGLCTKGIRHRLLRSVLTTMVVVLAVAFFMNLLADSVVARAVDIGVREELQLARRSAVATDLWFGRPSANVLAGRLAVATAPLPGYAALTGWPLERIQALAGACARERRFLGWLDGLDSGTRAMLVRRVRNEGVIAWLADPQRWDEFATSAARLRSQRLPIPLDEVRRMAADAPATRSELDALVQVWHAKVAELEGGMRLLTGATDRAGWIAWLAGAQPAELAGFSKLLTQTGFAAQSPPEQVASLQGDLRLDLLRDGVSAILVSDEGRQRWRAAFRTQPSLEEKLLLLGDERAHRVLEGRFAPEELQRLADTIAAARDLTQREAALVGKIDPAGGLVSTRQALLVAISFLVCMVGIANAMLMAITERFREIATMKCLGATDSFILTQFLMEAGIQGAAGGAMGMVLGLILTLIKGGWLYGGHLLWYFPAIELLVAGIACIVAGLLLATLASIYPSWMASRMAPMEAMRVE
jgi:hypothetical protein